VQQNAGHAQVMAAAIAALIRTYFMPVFVVV
jgi:hypothetical protein